jgi:two-component system, cell cycle response regulator DivK
MSENEKALILIVDDFEANRELNSFILSSEGFRVDSATDGQEALHKTLHLLPDLIILDLSLPDMSGWDVVRRLKSDDKTKQIPIIVLTGYSIEHLESEVGCERVLIKPCLPDKIVAEVAAVLGNRRSAAAGRFPA